MVSFLAIIATNARIRPRRAGSSTIGSRRCSLTMVEDTASAPSVATPGELTPEGPNFDCAICWQDVPGEPSVLPCCGRPPVGSSTVYCARCLEIICENGPCGVGRCPTCQGFMQKAPGGGGLTVAAGVDECGVCHQASQPSARVAAWSPATRPTHPQRASPGGTEPAHKARWFLLPSGCGAHPSDSDPDRGPNSELPWP